MKNLISKNISGTSPVIEQFEKTVAKKFNRKYGVAVSNGSVALDLALRNLNLKKGDEVIVPSFTIISCLSAVIRTEAKPIFCDVDKDTWNMTLEDIKKVFTKKTKAIVIVHTYGLPADAVKISKFCIENSVSLVEDAAEAHGQTIDGLKCGSFGKMTTFSFYANKHITTGEGGMVLTDDFDIFNNLKQMRNLDFTGTNRFNHDHFYWNYRLGGLQAALGISQLKNLEKTIKIKKTQGKNYLSILEQHKDIFQMPIVDFNKSENHFWVFGVVLQKQNIRDKVMADLADEGIETRPFFWPLHLQNVLPKEFKQKNISLEVSENLGKNGLYLPMGSHINFQKQKYIVSKLVQIHNSYVS